MARQFLEIHQFFINKILYNIIKHTVETPVKSDLTKCEDLVLAYGRQTLKRIELQRSLPRNIPCTSTF